MTLAAGPLRVVLDTNVLLAGGATHLVSMDADLLSLPSARTDAGKRFRQRLPHLAVLTPQQFVEESGEAIGGA